MKKITKIFAIAAILFSGLTMFNACNDDPCKDVNCGTNGTCDNGTCLCNTGYEGSACETLATAKFIGNHNVSDTCSNTITYTSSISQNSTDITKINIENFLGLGTGVIASADVSGSTFTVPNGNSGVFSWMSVSGSINGTTTTINYTLNDGAASCTGVATYTRI